MLTRFVASEGSPRDAIEDDPATIEDIRCLVRLRGSRGERELVIATELGGGIRVFGSRDGLTQRARTQLAFHEVASGRVVELEADELHVLDLQTLEMLPDAPGPNDALYAYGPMRGPYPAKLGAPMVAVDGQLTVTRVDLLVGLIDGVTNAFAYAPDQHGSRCVHALLPGERADAIDAGRGIVLALPLVPGWLIDCPVSNDLVAAQIIYDILSALRSDLGAGTDVPALPVPSRAAYEQKLVAAGWRIDGDEAVRPKGRGIIGSIFKGGDRRTLPRQGTLDELVAEACATLARIPAITTPEVAALRRRFMGSASSAVSAARPPIAPPIPAASAAPQPALAPRPRVATDRSEWMRDFVEAHRTPSRPPPRVSAPARAVSPAATPSWMDDFDEPDDSDAPDPDPTKPSEWSKDFD